MELEICIWEGKKLFKRSPVSLCFSVFKVIGLWYHLILVLKDKLENHGNKSKFQCSLKENELFFSWAPYCTVWRVLCLKVLSSSQLLVPDT